MRRKYAVLTLFVFALLSGCQTSYEGLPIYTPDPCQVSGTKCKVGDIGPGGGRIFYDAGSQKTWGRYLESAGSDDFTDYINVYDHGPDEYGVSSSWSSDLPGRVLGTSTKIGSGKSNTKKIISSLRNRGSAAAICARYRAGGKNDWFLPSRDELKAYYKFFDSKDYHSETYWTSSQYAGKQKTYNSKVNYAWYFDQYSEPSWARKTSDHSILPIRAF